MKNFNSISITGGIFGGILSFIFGGFDLLLKALIVLVILDYITGFIKGVITKTLSSEVGYKGLLKKIVIFIVVIVSVVLQNVINNAIPLRETVIIFFICNEGISILENASEFIPIPEKLKNVLMQLRQSNDDESEAEND